MRKSVVIGTIAVGLVAGSMLFVQKPAPAQATIVPSAKAVLAMVTVTHGGNALTSVVVGQFADRAACKKAAKGEVAGNVGDSGVITRHQLICIGEE